MSLPSDQRGQCTYMFTTSVISSNLLYISAVHIFYLVCEENVNVPDSIHYVYLRE